LNDAAEVLNYYNQEGNEKVIVLLSDGAHLGRHWQEPSDDRGYGEIEISLKDPASLADNLHAASGIRVHTIAITTKEDFQNYRRNATASHTGFDVSNTQPDTALLRTIASVTEGIYFEKPGTRGLNKLFDEIGEGVTYPLGSSARPSH